MSGFVKSIVAASLVLAMCSACSAALVGYWTFDDITGTNVPDSAGADDTGTLTGATVVASTAPVPGGSASALDFDGAKPTPQHDVTFLDTGNLSPTGDWSYAAWINPDSVTPADDGGRQNLYGDSSAGSADILQVYLEHNEINTFWRGNTGDTELISSGAGVAAGSWQHLAVVRSGVSVKYYLGGSEVFSGSLPASTTVDTSGGGLPVTGIHPTAGNVWLFKGQLDDMRIYNHALTESEILALNPLVTATEWRNNASGDWNTPGSWLPSTLPDSNTMSVTFGSVITVPQTVVTNSAVTVKNITFDNANTYAIVGTGSVNLDSNTSLSTISVVNGSHEFQAVVNLVNSTDVDVSTTALLTFNNALNLSGNTLTKTGAGMMLINNVLNTGSGSVVVASGVVGGFGEVGGDLSNTGGTVAPGNSTGKLSVAGNFSQTSGSLLIEIDGTTAESEYDVLDVNGSLTMNGGSLDVVMGFTPTPGNTFDVLNFASANGTGVTLNLGSPSGSVIVWDSSQLFVNGILSVVSVETIQEQEWASDVSGDWNLISNWTPASIPNANIDVAVFGSAITAPQTVFTNSAVTVKAIRFENANSYAIVGQGSVNLEAALGNASITVVQGSHQFQAIVNLVSETDVDVKVMTDTLSFNNILNLNSNNLNLVGLGTVQINNDLNTGTGSVNASAGVVSGNGSISGTLNNSGATVAPGNSPGELTVGNYLQTDGTLLIEIGGTNDGSAPGNREFDRLNVSGELTIRGGSLDVVMINGFVPTPGDTFDILDFTTIDLSGATLNLGTPGADMAWDSSQLSADGTLTALSALLGDIDGDFAVTTADVSLFVQALVDRVSYNANGFFVVGADFNGDVDGSGTFDLGDLSALSSLLSASASAAAVPEPNSLMLLGITLIAALLRRRWLSS